MNAVATKARRGNVYVSKHASGYTLTDINGQWIVAE